MKKQRNYSLGEISNKRKAVIAPKALKQSDQFFIKYFKKYSSKYNF